MTIQVDGDDQDLERFPDHHKLVYKSKSIQVFDKVKVSIWVRESEDHHRELMMDLVDPSFVSDSNGKKIAFETEAEGGKGVNPQKRLLEISSRESPKKKKKDAHKSK